MIIITKPPTNVLVVLLYKIIFNLFSPFEVFSDFFYIYISNQSLVFFVNKMMKYHNEDEILNMD
jgi:hypothetical protein